MRALTDLSTLVFLNILTLLFSIPIVTAGAALAAMHYVIIEMIEERGGSLPGEFWKRFKENLKNATPIWLILLAAAGFLYADIRLITGGQQGLPRAMLIPIYAGLFVTAAIYVYVIPLTARFVYSTGGFQERRYSGSGLFSQDSSYGRGQRGDPVPASECDQAPAAVFPAGDFPAGISVRAFVQADFRQNNRREGRGGQALGPRR